LRRQIRPTSWNSASICFHVLGGSVMTGVLTSMWSTPARSALHWEVRVIIFGYLLISARTVCLSHYCYWQIAWIIITKSVTVTGAIKLLVGHFYSRWLH